MRKLISELYKFEVAANGRMFNGYNSVESYQNHLWQLYGTADCSLLVNENHTAIIKQQIEDFSDYCTSIEQELQKNMNVDTLNDTLKGCIEAKRECFGRLMLLIDGNCHHANINTGDAQCNDSGWYNVREICARYPVLSYNKVKSRTWRIAHGFPQNPEYKGKQMFNESDVEHWIREHLQ